VLFGVAFALLFATEALFLKLRRPRAEKATPALRIVSAPAQARSAAPYGRFYGIALAALALSAVLSAFLAWPRSVVPPSDTLARVPLKLGDWTGTDYPLDERTYEILGTRDVLSRVYSDDGGDRVQLVVVLAQQTRKRTHPPEQCFAGEGYSVEQSDVRDVSLPPASGAAAVGVKELVLTMHDQKRLVWYFFKSGDHLTTSYWKHQVGLALSKLTHPDAADVLIRVDTVAPGGDMEAARRLLGGFLGESYPELTTRLP
jgi:EpsI family protein